MGDENDVRRVFPSGLAGGDHIPFTFESIKTNGFVVRPIGVALVQVIVGRDTLVICQMPIPP